MNSITLWYALGTVGMALGTILLAYGWRYVPAEAWRPYATLVAVPGIAVVAYALMAAGIGGVPSAVGGTVFLPRYADWLLTTPLHIVFLGLFAGAARRHTTRAAGFQAVTIVLGAAAALVAGPLKWLLFLAGVAAFGAVVYVTYVQFDAAARERGGTTFSRYRRLRAFLVVLWSVYPIIWLVGPNAAGLMDVETTALVVAYIDVVSKIGLGLIALNGYVVSAGAGSAEPVPAD
jgi:sensory rhodopsin